MHTDALELINSKTTACLMDLDQKDSEESVRSFAMDNSLRSFKLYGRKANARGRYIRNGVAYDANSVVPISYADSERAAKLKQELASLTTTDVNERKAYLFVKRVFDVVFSGAVLVLFSWLYLLIALLIKLDDPKGPVLFKQTRVGLNGKEFVMYNFRSMCVDAEDRLDELRELNEKTGPVFKIAEDPCITRVGKWLRKLSLDELPQFINVFVGDMGWRILNQNNLCVSQVNNRVKVAA